MISKKHLFDIPEDVTYLNAANMSPLLQSTNAAGKAAIDQKSHPYKIKGPDFFNPLKALKNVYAQLIDTHEAERIAAIPSVSYGISTVVNNIVLKSGDEILVIEDQFPSNIYAWQQLATQYDAVIRVVKKPTEHEQCGKVWNARILNLITEKTAVVAIGNIHWADGTIFDIKAISTKVKSVQSLLIVDGSQSIGAMPFSVEEIQPDALICAGYKWLLGPYSFGLAYYGPYFDHGVPIEENWSNRLHSENFAGLTQYEENYKPLANRYNVGENGNFIAIPMLTDSISQILKWDPKNIQNHCHSISKHVIAPLRTLGCIIEEDDYRAKHLFGIKLPTHIDLDKLKQEFEQKNIFVSYRGQYIRISCHLFNRSKDFDKLLNAIQNVLR